MAKTTKPRTRIKTKKASSPLLLDSPFKIRPELPPPPPMLIHRDDHLPVARSPLTRVFLVLIVSIVAVVVFTASLLTTAIPAAVIVVSALLVWAAAMVGVAVMLRKK